MALIDSKASFDAQCDKIDESEELKKLMHRNNLRCFSELGYAIGTPQTPASDAEFRAFCTRLNSGAELDMASVSRVRRLHFEASTLVVAHLKSQVSPEQGTEAVKKIPAAEKQARLVMQQARLTGLHIIGELQPSHALIDLVASMIESNTVIWVPPSKCSSRDSEVQNLGKQKSATLSIEQQALKVTPMELQADVDTSTELKFQWAMQRRGVAFDQCGLIEWNTHQIWLQQLLNLLSKEAPEGYSRVRLDQLVKADKELFTIMAQETQIGNKKLTATPSPMNKAMAALSTDPRITMHLLPLPKNLKAPLRDLDDDKLLKVPKKPKRALSAKAIQLCPDELKGFKQTDSQNRAICWAYNMSKGCKETVSQGRCKKGVHVCIKCHRNNHGLATCRAKKE